MAELLTPSIAYAYNEKAKALPYNGMQDIGERRRLRHNGIRGNQHNKRFPHRYILH